MSLIFSNTSLGIQSPPGDETAEDEHTLEQLERYLAIIEDNKKACQFVPNDALVALDMAGFVCNVMNKRQNRMPISTARMAMALAQPEYCAPPQ